MIPFDKAMFDTVRLIGSVSRAEFIMPNLGSLIMGLAWGATPDIGFGSLAILVALSFTIINLSSAIGAQINTYSDYELDLRDARKRQLVQAMDSLGKTKVKRLLVIEFVSTLLLVTLFMLMQGKPILLSMWIVGIFLGWAYSAPPLRIKARSWLAPVTLVLVLAVFPVLFAYYTFASIIDPLFLLSLAGLALTVYGVIIPTEVRDYFGDKAMNIETMTVHLGLVRSSLLSMALLTSGATLIGTAFLLGFIHLQHPILSVFILAVPVVVLFVAGKFRKLYLLSKEYTRSDGQKSVVDAIVSLASHNPQWIMLVTQTYSFLSILFLVSKFLL
jgi:4-hydroxybenzoate polyprenyltransferase